MFCILIAPLQMTVLFHVCLMFMVAAPLATLNTPGTKWMLMKFNAWTKIGSFYGVFHHKLRQCDKLKVLVRKPFSILFPVQNLSEVCYSVLVSKA